MMDFEEFKDFVAGHITDYMPEEYSRDDVVLTEKKKNNGISLEGITFKGKRDGEAVPVLYLNPYYEEYKNGRDEWNIASGMAGYYISSLKHAEMLGKEASVIDLTSYDSVKDRLICRLVNRERNEDLLAETPHTDIEDLAVTYHVQIMSGGNEIASVRITDQMMEHYGVDKKILHEQALKNMDTLSRPMVKPLNEIIMSMLVSEFMKDNSISEDEAKDMLSDTIIPDDGPAVYCVSNVNGINGAASIVSPAVQEKLAERIGGDYYILPSSVHEVLVLPKSQEGDYESLQEMVQDINGKIVKPDEILSDKVYEYNAQTREIKLAENCVRSMERAEMQPLMQERMVGENPHDYNAGEPKQEKTMVKETKKHGARTR